MLFLRIIKSKHFLDCLEMLKTLHDNGNKLKLVWVPGRFGVEGNEIAVSFVKYGFKMHIS